MEGFANAGAMLPEQVWDESDLPNGHMECGGPTGSAMPLCWTHAEYVTLVRSRMDGVGFDFIPSVYKRYVETKPQSKIEMWTLAHQLSRVPTGKRLRIILGASATVHWSTDGWQTVHDQQTSDSGLGCWFAELPTAELDRGSRVLFTFRWPDRWEGRDFAVEIL
jgi:glucoamylase